MASYMLRSGGSFLRGGSGRLVDIFRPMGKWVAGLLGFGAWNLKKLQKIVGLEKS